MSRLAGSRILAAALAMLVGPGALLGKENGAGGHAAETSPVILVGFVGGFVHHDDLHHGPVFLAQHLRQQFPNDIYIQVFENRRRKMAYRTILGLLDRNHDGVLSDREKEHARIVLFGQSWGASSVVLLARDLDRAGIPVLLTVQVDSVAKPWEHDGPIPDNVAAAVNFYQPHGFLRGRREIRAANDSRTQILGNFRYDYHGMPAPCPGISWVERTFVPGHVYTDCDANLWGKVESVVRQRLDGQPGVAEAAAKP